MKNKTITNILLITGLSVFSITTSLATGDFNDPIIVDKKSTIVFTLPSNHTTGYQWVASDYNYDLIKPTSYKYEADESGRNSMGSGGNDVFKFTVSKRFKTVPQVQTVTFQYIRPWGKAFNPETKTFTIISQV